jgi:hypothetical protein
MITQFHDSGRESALNRFQDWRRANTDGFFINCINRTTWKLHVTTCWHSGNSLWLRDRRGASLTRQRKICSDSLQELLTWAEQDGAPSLTCCTHCLPNSLFEHRRQLEREVSALAELNSFDPHNATDARRWVLATTDRASLPAEIRAADQSNRARVVASSRDDHSQSSLCVDRPALEVSCFKRNWNFRVMGLA